MNERTVIGKSAKSSVILVGIDYRDRLNGPPKLEELLEKIRPDFIIHAFSEGECNEIYKVMGPIMQCLEDTIDDKEKLQDAFEKMYDIAMPWSISVGNQYAEKAGARVGYAFRPGIYRRNIELSYRLASNLERESQGQKKLDPSALWEIDNAMTRFFGPPPTENLVSSYWNFLNSEEFVKRNSIENFIGLYLLSPTPFNRIRVLSGIAKSLTKENQVGVIPFVMHQIADSFGTVYSRTKKYGVQRIPLLQSAVQSY